MVLFEIETNWHQVIETTLSEIEFNVHIQNNQHITSAVLEFYNNC